MRVGLRPIVRATTHAAQSTSTTATTTTTSITARRALSATAQRRGGAGHGPEFDPPTGWLFGVKPGEKAEKEGWESLMFYGFGGSLLVFAVAYAFKPDTSIQTWALEEARRRLEAEGILEDPTQKK